MCGAESRCCRGRLSASFHCILPLQGGAEVCKMEFKTRFLRYVYHKKGVGVCTECVYVCVCFVAVHIV